MVREERGRPSTENPGGSSIFIRLRSNSGNVLGLLRSHNSDEKAHASVQKHKYCC